MNTQHTAGPWTVEVIDGETRIATVERTFKGSSDGHRVATIGNARWANDETRADAQLIAAAPDGLAFAFSFVEWVEQIRALPGGLKKHGLPGMEAREREARAFIAKARGV